MNQLEEIKIENLIYEIRGKQVMLDSDLAKLYQCKNGTKEINQAVKNNKIKFPERYAFRITDGEYNYLKSKHLTSNILSTRGGSRKGHTVFTEQGVAMLATILKTRVATEVSIQIMYTFVAMRKFISNNLIEQNYMNQMLLKHDNDIKLLQESFSKFEEKRIVNEIYFDGQIYDSYSKILDIMKEAKDKLIIVDGYADKTVLDMIKNLKCKIILIVKNKSLISKLDVEKYNKQYNNLKIIYSDIFHDRYFIIDDNKIYHCGSSINHIGSKVFSINILEDEIVKQLLVDKIKQLIN